MKDDNKDKDRETTSAAAEQDHPEASREDAASTAPEPDSHTSDPAAAEGSATQADTPDASATVEAAPGDGGAGVTSTASDGPPPRRSRLSILALLLAVIMLGLLGYGFYQVPRLHAQLEERHQALADSLEENRQTAGSALRRLDQLQQQLTQARQRSQSQQSRLETLQTRLEGAIDQLSRKQTRSRKDWLVAEAEYLLRLANQRVLVEETPAGALQLLQSADRILRTADDVSLYRVREALATDIARLEAVPDLDVEGTFLRLSALDQQIEKLRQVPLTDRHQLPEMLQQITPEAVEASWQQDLSTAWARAMDRLGQLIVVRHRDEPIEPLLSPKQSFFLRQNLHLLLEQSQVALLEGQQAAYEQSLNKAQDWVQRYFEQEDAASRALIQGLSALSTLNVDPELPDISDSLKALKSYLEKRHDAGGEA